MEKHLIKQRGKIEKFALFFYLDNGSVLPLFESKDLKIRWMSLLCDKIPGV